MTFKNFIQTVWRKFHKTAPAAPASRESRALFHWEIIVISFLLAVTAVFFNSFLIYRDINQGDFFPANQKTLSPRAPVTAADINNTLNYFKIKNAAFEQIIKNQTVSVDPSR